MIIELDAYEPPQIVAIGTVEDLTRGDADPGADFQGSENVP